VPEKGWPEPGTVANRTHIHRPPPPNPRRAQGKIRLVLKRISSPLDSRTSAANALSPAVDVRGHGSAAMLALSVGADHTGAHNF
jgi:hypothetical protein